jgi:hypothetical protein
MHTIVRDATNEMAKRMGPDGGGGSKEIDSRQKASWRAASATQTQKQKAHHASLPLRNLPRNLEVPVAPTVSDRSDELV